MLGGPPIIHVGGPKGPFGVSSLPGCRSSLTNSQALTSSGSSGLDQILGGGIPVGSVLIFEEKPFSLHNKRFLHVFAAEGLAVLHSVVVAAPPDTTSLTDFISLIPCKFTDNGPEKGDAKLFPERNETRDSGSESLKIAWRYENAPKVNPVMGSVSAFSSEQEYDLGKRLDPLKASSIRLFKAENGWKAPHEALIRWLVQESASTGSRNLMRVVLPSIDSPLWGFQDIHEFCRFLFQLRTLVRNSNTIVCLTVSQELHDVVDLHRIRRQCDAYVALETLPDGAPRSALFREFQSICRVQKGFSLNALRPPQMTDFEFGLKIRKRKMTFERLHLPPALQETVQRETGAVNKHASVGLNCQTASESRLDF